LAFAEQGRPRGRILYSLLLLLLLVGTAPLLVTSFRLVTDTRERLELEQKQRQLSTTKSLSNQVALYVRSLTSQVRSIAQTLEVSAPGRSYASRQAEIRRTRALEPFVDPDAPLPFYYVAMLDLACRGPGSGINLLEPAIERLMQEGCARAREDRSMVSQPVMSTSVREPILVISVPVKTKGSEVAGVVVAVASLRPLWGMARQMASGGYDVYIVDDRGWLVAHSDPSRLTEDRDLSSVEIVRSFLATRGLISNTEPFFLEKGGAQVRMLGTYARVPDDSSGGPETSTGWGVIAQVSDAEAFYAAHEARRQAIILTGIVTLLAIVFGTVFAGQISRPVQELARGARRLASGDYGTRVKVRSRNEVGFLAGAFNQMGEEIQRAIEEIRRQAEVNKELFVGSIRMLANAIDEKDPYTRGHSDRVAYYSRCIARHMAMPEDDVEKVYLAGILHDVGKIGIEDKILRKAGALTDEEYEIMKQHPKKGEYILAAVPMLRDMTGDGLKHHENVDGSGYPDRLKGDEIPLLGRIVSVADAFDAMTTDRPYSKAWTVERAIARLRELAGVKFDETVVVAMEKAFAEGDLETAKVRAATRLENTSVAEAGSN